MRVLTLVALFVVTSFVFGAEPIPQEQPHQRFAFYNWDFKDLGTTAFEDLPAPASLPVPALVNQSEHCPDGWLRYSDSCYWVEAETLGFAKAERKCAEKGASLFVANSQDEWDEIREHTKDNTMTWIGLVRFSHYEKTEKLPRWQTTGSINPAKLNWLIKPFTPLTNGWNSMANCAAHFLSSVDTSSYTFFYPCTLMFGSICERNSTIANFNQ